MVQKTFSLLKTILITILSDFHDNYTAAVFGGAPIIFSNAQNITASDNKFNSDSHHMVTADGTVTNLTMNRNYYKSKTADSSTAVFAWNGITGVNYTGFEQYKAATGQDSLSTF